MSGLLLFIFIIGAVLFIKRLKRGHKKNKKYDFLIYKATNKQNGKVYIGSTKYRNLDKRKQWHHKDAFYNKKQSPFYSALREYGARAFKWEVVERMHSTKAQAENKEYEYIKQYRDNLGYDDVYNKIGSRQEMWRVVQQQKQYRK